MNKTAINWGYDNFYTWNPVTGCKRGCSYCYARAIHERRRAAIMKAEKLESETCSLPAYYREPFNVIQIHEDRFYDEGLCAKKPRTIFVGSMSDIGYWPTGILKHVAELCGSAKRHTFLFLSKDYTVYNGILWPTNTMQGVTITCEKEVAPQRQIIEAFLRSKNRRNFFSFEPLLGTLKVEVATAERVIVGATTGPGATIPKKEWIQSVRDNVPERLIFWKENIRKYL